MMYYIIISVLAITFDICYSKKIKNKSDVALYIIVCALTISATIYYYIDPLRIGLAEYVINILKIGGG